MRGRELNSYAGRELPPAAAPPPKRSGCIFSARLAAPLCAALDAGRACVFSSRGMACGRHRRPAWSDGGQTGNGGVCRPLTRPDALATTPTESGGRTLARASAEAISTYVSLLSRLLRAPSASAMCFVQCRNLKVEELTCTCDLARARPREPREIPLFPVRRRSRAIYSSAPPPAAAISPRASCTVPPCQSLTADSAVGCTGCM
jgi:hypothetical protein